jgi:hypothetical protein
VPVTTIARAPDPKVDGLLFKAGLQETLAVHKLRRGDRHGLARAVWALRRAQKFLCDAEIIVLAKLDQLAIDEVLGRGSKRAGRTTSQGR